jgi:flagellum-specific peptidoglycan hydrolase FlgJ
VQAYVAEVYRLAPLVGLDPAIVVAQSAHESGYWQSEIWVEHLNPAGIGVTGPNVPSPTWGSGEDAARAQIVHLYLYAAGEIGPGHPLEPYLALDPRYEAALGAGRAASARTIADLSGRWATDPLYADGIARVGNELFAAD